MLFLTYFHSLNQLLNQRLNQHQHQYNSFLFHCLFLIELFIVTDATCRRAVFHVLRLRSMRVSDGYSSTRLSLVCSIRLVVGRVS